jgi:cytochrome c
MNDIIDDEFEVNQGNISTIEMPIRDGFMLPDPQPILDVACMKDCDVPTQIIGRARDIDVIPEDES